MLNQIWHIVIARTCSKQSSDKQMLSSLSGLLHSVRNDERGRMVYIDKKN